MIRTPYTFAAILLAGLAGFALAPAPGVAQVCLGRTLPGQGSLAVDVATSEEMATRVSLGGIGPHGVGFRVGLVGVGRALAWEARGMQAELSISRPIADSVEACVGGSILLPLPQNEMAGVLDLFASIGFRAPAGRTASLITFVTPHLTRVFDTRVGEVTNPNELLTRGREPFDSYVALGATLGVGLLVDPFTFRGTLSILGPHEGNAGGALGFGVAVRGGPRTQPSP